jgi:putative membrane protein
MGAAAFNLSFAPALQAQVPANPPTNAAAPDGSQNTKSTDSTADQQSGTTGTANTDSQAKMDSKSTGATNAVDANPSQSSTGSADQSATKMPSPDADKTSSGGSSTMGTPSDMDKTFMMKAAQGGMMEVELGKIAQDQATTAKIKAFGTRMVKDHSRANMKLKTVADAQGVTLGDSLDSKHQAMVDNLKGMSGAAFDKAYVDMMVTAHEKDAAAFQKELDSTDDSGLKKWTMRTLKVVHMHLSMIKDIQSSM